MTLGYADDSFVVMITRKERMHNQAVPWNLGLYRRLEENAPAASVLVYLVNTND